MTASFSINAKDAAERIHAAIGGRPPRASGSGYVLCCPAHDDLAVGIGIRPHIAVDVFFEPVIENACRQSVGAMI